MINRVCILFFLFWNIPTGIFSQCAAVSPNNPTLFANDLSVGTFSWTNPQNVGVSDNIFATCSQVVAILSSASSNYIMESGFGFAIPPTASICGIQVDVEKMQQGAGIGSSVSDNSVKIVKGGVIVGTEHATGTSWPAAKSYFSYGGSADLWGTTWTPADINAANFGVACSSAKLNSGLIALSLTAKIDNVRITVFYNNGLLPVELTDFSASCHNRAVELKWTTASQINNDYFTLERSSDAENFEQVGIIDGAGNSDQLMNYSFSDNKPHEGLSYYRLKQTDFNAESRYFDLISVNCESFSLNHFFPNPSSGKFTIEATGDLTIYNLNGDKIYSLEHISNKTHIDLQAQPSGVYYYQLKSSDESIVYGKLIIQ